MRCKERSPSIQGEVIPLHRKPRRPLGGHLRPIRGTGATPICPRCCGAGSTVGAVYIGLYTELFNNMAESEYGPATARETPHIF